MRLSCRWKYRILDAVVIAVILAGAGILSYPSFSEFVNQYYAGREIVQYQKNQKQEEESDIELSETEKLKKLADAGEMLGYVDIPKIQVYLPVYYGTSDKVLGKGLGLLEHTELPVEGGKSNAVISGHSGLASRKLLTDLTMMEEGDLFFLHILSRHYAYQVDEIEVILPDEKEKLYTENSRDRVTLLTCTPFGVNDHRLLVRGSRIPYDFSKKGRTVPSGSASWWKYWWIGVWAVILLAFFRMIRKKRKCTQNTGGKEEKVRV